MSGESSHAEVPHSPGERVKSNPLFLEVEMDARPRGSVASCCRPGQFGASELKLPHLLPGSGHAGEPDQFHLCSEDLLRFTSMGEIGYTLAQELVRLEDPQNFVLLNTDLFVTK